MLLLAAPYAWAYDSTNDHVTMPAQNASFYTDLQRWLRADPAARLKETTPNFLGWVFSGGLHGTSPTMTSPPFATTGYASDGYYVNQASLAIDYAAVGGASDDTCWVALNSERSGNLGNFHRVGTSHYIVNCVDTTQPTQPANSTYLMRVTLSGGAITEVRDLRRRGSGGGGGGGGGGGDGTLQCIDAADFGATPDNVTDVGIALRAALAAAESNRCVCLAAGLYNLSSSVPLNDGACIVGEPTWGFVGTDHSGPSPRYDEHGRAGGTYIAIANASFDPFPVVGVGARVDSLVFAQVQPPPTMSWIPVAHPYLFQNTTGCAWGFEATNILLYGIDKAFAFDGNVSGCTMQRLRLHNIFGQVFTRFLFLDRVNPGGFLSNIFLAPMRYDDPTVLTYTKANAVGMELLLAVGLDMHGVVMRGLDRGIWHRQGPDAQGGSFTATNLAMNDMGGAGVYIEGLVTGSIMESQITSLVCSAGSTCVAAVSPLTPVRVTLANVFGYGQSDDCVYAEGGATLININGLTCENWGNSAIRAVQVGGVSAVGVVTLHPDPTKEAYSQETGGIIGAQMPPRVYFDMARKGAYLEYQQPVNALVGSPELNLHVQGYLGANRVYPTFATNPNYVLIETVEGNPGIGFNATDGLLYRLDTRQLSIVSPVYDTAGVLRVLCVQDFALLPCDASPGGGGGTVTQVNTGTGLVGGPITTTGTIAIANTVVTAGSYTCANLTVNAQGQLTAASNGSCSGGGGGTIDTFCVYNAGTDRIDCTKGFTFDSDTKYYVEHDASGFPFIAFNATAGASLTWDNTLGIFGFTKPVAFDNDMSFQAFHDGSSNPSLAFRPGAALTYAIATPRFAFTKSVSFDNVSTLWIGHATGDPIMQYHEDAGPIFHRIRYGLGFNEFYISDCVNFDTNHGAGFKACHDGSNFPTLVYGAGAALTWDSSQGIIGSTLPMAFAGDSWFRATKVTGENRLYFSAAHYLALRVIAGTPVSFFTSGVSFGNSGQFNMSMISGNPTLTWQSGRYMQYVPAANQLEVVSNLRFVNYNSGGAVARYLLVNTTGQLSVGGAGTLCGWRAARCLAGVPTYDAGATANACGGATLTATCTGNDVLAVVGCPAGTLGRWAATWGDVTIGNQHIMTCAVQ